ncbi:MAG: hypothetical protein J7642_21225 [Cyanobacteria bacterium SBC]|nr:hypothetical protein [Cyanobacteria bacterium SBC]
MPEKEPIYRITITISENAYRFLLLKGKITSAGKSGVARQIVDAEALNTDRVREIEEAIARTAKLRGLSADELMEQWFQEEGYSPSP